MQKIKISSIERNILNPRKNFDSARLQELADSIKEVGIIEPLVVSAYKPDHDGSGEYRFRIIAGERRYRAATIAGLQELPCIVRFDLTAEQEIRLALTENLQRQDLDPIEEARAYKLLLDMRSGVTQEALAKELGVSQAHIANRIRLLELPESAQDNISREIISPSVARELLACKKADPSVIEAVAKKAADEGMTVKQVSQMVDREMYNNSRLLTGDSYNSAKFDTNDCDGCKKKTMLKVPWDAEREELRCLDVACWDAKQGELEKQRTEEKEQELLAKYPDAVIINDLKQKIQTVGYIREYCQAKNCTHFKVGRRRGVAFTENICLNPESNEACQVEREASKKECQKEQETAARAEIKDLVDAKLKVRSDRKTLVYIATIILEHLDPPWQAGMNVFQYVQEIAAGVELEDVTEENEETWIQKMLKRFSEEQLFRIIIEWPAICDGMEEGSVIEWYLKDTSGPDEEKEEGFDEDDDTDPDGHGVCRVCGCTDAFACPGGCYWVEPDLCSSCVEAVGQESTAPAADYVPLEEFDALIEPEQASPTAPVPKTYIDDQGRELFISSGLWENDGQAQYGTFWRNHTGGLHRVKSPAMPMVATREEAQINLDTWAEKKGLKTVTEEPSAKVLTILDVDDADPEWIIILAGLADTEVVRAYERETRPSARSKLYKEARRRKLSTKAEAS